MMMSRTVTAQVPILDISWLIDSRLAVHDSLQDLAGQDMRSYVDYL